MELNHVSLEKIQVFFGNDVKDERSNEVSLFLMLEGQGVLEIEGNSYIMNSDDIILVNPNAPYSFQNSPNGLCACFLISSEDLITNSNDKSLFFLCNSVEYPDQAKFSQLRVLLKYMVKDYTKGNIENPSYLQYSDYFKLLHILTSFFSASERRSTNVDYEKKRITDIVNYIKAKYSEDISLTNLADYLGLTESYISRRFKTYFQKSFIDYLYDVRLEKAKLLLEESEKSLTDISFDCGFPNLATLNKRFKEKYGISPANYRLGHKKEVLKAKAKEKKESKEAKKALSRYFNSEILPSEAEQSSAKENHEMDFKSYQNYKSIWNWCINVGPAESVLNSDMQSILKLAESDIHFFYGRIWNLFSPNMYIVSPKGSESDRSSKYNRLFRVIDFMLGIGMTPIIELGEKRTHIRKTTTTNVKESENKTLFKDYNHFLGTLQEMMLRLSEAYGEEEISKWIFELWDDERIEAYRDKKTYMQVFSDVRDIIKSVVPNVKFGGAGNYLGWSQRHTENSLRRWMDNGVYPDYLTFTYSPYHGSEDDRNLFKIKADENDLLQTLDSLNDTLAKFCFPPMSGIYISEWNMTESSRNYFNDSVWKASYVVKCYLDALGKVDGLFYSQLCDITTDYYDNQKLLTGSGGLITRDQIEKPAFLAMRLLKHLLPFVIDKGEDYIVTRDQYGKIVLICFNFIERNYNYYLKEEDENSLEDHYSYFADQNKKSLHFHIKNLPEDGEYVAHHHVINRECGSIMDEWAKFGFSERLQPLDFEYLRKITAPRLFYTTENVVNGTIDLNVTLEPLEVRCISIRKKH